MPCCISLQILSTFVFLNLVVAVILENFSSLSNLDPTLVSSSDIDAFKDVWADLDPDADNYIPSADLVGLILSLPPPMGLNGAGDVDDAQRLILKLSIKQTGGKVAFQEVRRAPRSHARAPPPRPRPCGMALRGGARWPARRRTTHGVGARCACAVQVLTALTRQSYVKSKPGNDWDAIDVPKPPPPPPLAPLARAQTSLATDRFATEQPSVRRVYALQVIEKKVAASRWGRERKERMARGKALAEGDGVRGGGEAPPVARAGYLRAAGNVRSHRGALGGSVLGVLHEEAPAPLLAEDAVGRAEDLTVTSQKRSSAIKMAMAMAEPDKMTNMATHEFTAHQRKAIKPRVYVGKRRTDDGPPRSPTPTLPPRSAPRSKREARL